MEYVRHTDCGDGYRRADIGTAFNGVAAIPKTANATISPTDVGKCFSNTGAGSTVQLTLPVPKAGMWFMFVVVAAQTFEVLPSSGIKINNGSTKISAAGTQAGIGVAYVFSPDGLAWFVFLQGTWTTS